MEKCPDSEMKMKNSEVSPSDVDTKCNIMKAVRSSACVAAHLLIVIIVCVSITFALRNGFTDLSVTSQHIILCVIGYQLLAAEAILCLAPRSWLPTFSLKLRRRAHWMLQTVGSILGLTGGILKSIDKTNRKGVNWNTLHGRFGLASMIFTTICLMNGLISLYAHELRKILPRNICKLSHYCCGIFAISTACICLAYGYDKNSFRTWAGPFADLMILIIGVLILSVIVNPLATLYSKTSSFKKK